MFDKLCEQAANGDVAAAKLLLERICGKDADEILLTDDREGMHDEEFARRVVSMLSVLQARKASVRN